MRMHCITHHGFRYCTEVKDHGKREKGASGLERWYRVVWVLMGMVFLLFLLIML